MELEGKTIAVTGVGGFIGLRMVARARARGMRVRGLDVSPGAARRAEAAGAEVAIGDVCDAAVVRRACEGADVVLHTAAILKEDGPRALFQRVNVEGTRAVAEAARRAGAVRLVHLSSVMVYGFDYPPHVTEDGPLRGEGNPYCETKIESERVALARHEPGGLEVIVVRPGDVYGPGSVPWVVRPVEMMRRGILILPDGGRGIINHVHVDNLIDAIFLALEKDAVARPFNVTDGQATTFADYFGRLAAMVGRRRPVSLPVAVLRPLSALVARAAELLGKEPPFSPAALSYVTRKHPVSIAWARRRLGYAPKVTLDEGMAEVERWIREEGLAR